MEPFIVARGVRSSWLTMPKNSARSRSTSCTAVISWMVTTRVSTSPPSVWIGVQFISAETLRPSDTSKTISSARTISPELTS